MAKRLDLILILVFTVIVLLRPAFLVDFISRKEVVLVLNLGVSGFLLYYLYGLIKNRKTTDRFFLKLMFSLGIMVVPVLFLTGFLEFENQTLLLYLIILGFFYMTMM